MSAARANRSGATGEPGRSTHQRWADKVLREKGYTFLRSSSNDHNIYENEAKQRITVSCSPRNEGNARRLVLNDVARHNGQRKMMPTTTQASPADLYLAMADQFLMTRVENGNGRAAKARHAALVGWTKRVLERHGPVKSTDFMAAIERMGFKPNSVNAARVAAGAISYNAGGSPSVWMICLEHQLPEGFNARKRVTNNVSAVDPIAPERAADLAGIPHEDFVPLQTNGKHELSDQQAAALMLLESLGIKSPGSEAKEALKKAEVALDEAKRALQAAYAVLS